MEENSKVGDEIVVALKARGSRVANLNEAQFRELFKLFKDVCKKHLGENDYYPINTKEKGKRAFRNWILNYYLPRYAADYIRHRYGPSSEQVWNYSAGDGKARMDAMPFEKWQIDEVTIDVESKFSIPNPQGDWEELDVKRPIVLRAIDMGSGGKLANRLILAPQVSAEDLSILLWDALNGPPVLPLVIGDLEYNKNGGYPATVIPQLRFAVPKFIYLDNALAHLADHVQHIISHLFGGVVLLGTAKTPQERADIEADFSAQAKKLIRKFPGATGSHPRDPLRSTARVELENRIDTAALEQVIDTYISNANGLPHARSGNISPLDRLRRQLASGALKPVYLSAVKRRPFYFSKPQRVVVHMDLRTGRRPYINYLYRRYTSTYLQSQVSMKNMIMWVRPDFHNLQSVLLFYESGEEFGEVQVTGPWSEFPHDVRIRKLFGRLLKSKQLGENAEDYPLESLFNYLRTRASKDRVCGQQLNYLVCYLLRHKAELIESIRTELQAWLDSLSRADELRVISIDIDQAKLIVHDKELLDTPTNVTLKTSTVNTDNTPSSNIVVVRNEKLPASISLKRR